MLTVSKGRKNNQKNQSFTIEDPENNMQKLNSQLKKLFFVFGLIACAIYCSLGSQSLVINVDIFLEEQNSDLTQIVQNAIQRFMNDHKNSSDLSFKLIRYNRMISDILSLDQVMGLNYNQSSSLHVAIFVHLSSHELVLASILENSDILTVGLFQTNGMSMTQVRRIALFLINCIVLGIDPLRYVFIQNTALFNCDSSLYFR